MSNKTNKVAEEARAARARIAAALEHFQAKYRAEALLEYELARPENESLYSQYEQNFGRLERSLETLEGSADEILPVDFWSTPIVAECFSRPALLCYPKREIDASLTDEEFLKRYEPFKDKSDAELAADEEALAPFYPADMMCREATEEYVKQSAYYRLADKICEVGALRAKRIGAKDLSISFISLGEAFAKRHESWSDALTKEETGAAINELIALTKRLKLEVRYSEI